MRGRPAGLPCLSRAVIDIFDTQLRRAPRPERFFSAFNATEEEFYRGGRGGHRDSDSVRQQQFSFGPN